LATLWLIHEFVSNIYKYISCFLKKYVQQLLGSIEGDFWNDSSDRNLLQRTFRGVIFKLGCSYGLPSFQKKAYELFRRFLNDKIKPHPDIRFTVYYYG